MTAEAMPFPLFIPFIVVFVLFGVCVSLMLADVFDTKPWLGFIVFGVFTMLICYAQLGDVL